MARSWENTFTLAVITGMTILNYWLYMYFFDVIGITVIKGDWFFKYHLH